MAHEDFEIDTDASSAAWTARWRAEAPNSPACAPGRASASMLEPIHVDAYGQMTPINQLGTVNVPEPRMVVINVWDKGMIRRSKRRSAKAASGSTRSRTAR
jgi:ribosome recycling factor